MGGMYCAAGFARWAAKNFLCVHRVSVVKKSAMRTTETRWTQRGAENARRALRGRGGGYGLTAGFGSGLRFLIQPLAIGFFLNAS